MGKPKTTAEPPTCRDCGKALVKYVDTLRHSGAVCAAYRMSTAKEAATKAKKAANRACKPVKK